MVKRSVDLSGAWSAAPTPLTKSLEIDLKSLKKMIAHHVNLRQKGLFLGGTCGEGPFLPEKEFRTLISASVEAARGRLVISAQVTDNSFTRVLENIKKAKKDGADIGIVAEPWFGPGFQTPEFLRKYYFETAEKSPIPIGIYSRGLSMPLNIYRELLLHPNVVLFKDSSLNEDIKKLAIETLKERPDIAILTGYELDIAQYLNAGYSGALAGGGILIGLLTCRMVERTKQGDSAAVIRLQKHSNRILYPAYGGKKIKSWLTGLKYTLVKMGIFSTTAGYLQYPLPTSVSNAIDTMIKKEKEILFPSVD